MNAKVLLLLAFAAAVAAESREQTSLSLRSYGRPSYDRSSEESYGQSDESREAKYEFSYSVKDYYGNDYGHQEKRDDDLTEGFYYNHLPDGRLQKVTYYVDGDSGYVADVSYEGEARYDSGESREYYGRQNSGSRESYRPPYGSNESK